MCGSMEHLLGSFPGKITFTWQVMETFSDDPNVSGLSVQKYKLYIRVVEMRGFA